MTVEPATSMNDIEMTDTRVLLEWWSYPEKYNPQTVTADRFRHEAWREIAARRRLQNEYLDNVWKLKRATAAKVDLLA